MIRIGMRLDEQASDAHRHGGTGQHRHELALPAGSGALPPGCCTEWVASNTTGAPCVTWAMIGRLRMSETRVL